VQTMPELRGNAGNTGDWVRRKRDCPWVRNVKAGDGKRENGSMLPSSVIHRERRSYPGRGDQGAKKEKLKGGEGYA